MTELEAGAPLSVMIRRLPDFQSVAGNARHADFWVRKRAFEAERFAWSARLREAKAPDFEQSPHFNGPVKLRAVLHFATAQIPDYDNAISGLKTLIDLFEMRRETQRRNPRTGHTTVSVKGLLGWLSNDRQIEWRWDVEPVKRSPHAPATWIEISPVGHEQRRLV